MYFDVLNSMSALTAPVMHYDSGVFPDDSEWYHLFERYVSSADDHRCVAYACSTDGKDEILLPTLSTRRSRLSSQLESLDNYYSVDYRPICSTFAAQALIEPLLRQLLEYKNPDLFWLRALDPVATEIGTIIHALKNLGWHPYISAQQINWIHDLKGDYEDYIASRSGRLRNTLRRKTAKLMAVSGMRLTVHHGVKDLEEAVHAYNQIYAKSWKLPEPHPEFIPELIRAVAGRGQLRLGILRLNDVPVAAHFWIVKRKTAFIYKLAHDRAFDGYSPGTVLMGQMIRYTMHNDNVSRLDFLSGDDRYKQDWMSERREKVQIHAYNPRRACAQWDRYLNEHIKPFVKQFSIQRLLTGARLDNS